jgi:hypothetical protein
VADDPLICGVDVSGGGAAWNVMAFRRGDARSIPRIRIPGEHTRDRSVSNQYASHQNTIFMTNTINLGSEVSSMDDTLTCPNCELVTLFDARFPNHGWLNALWKSVRTCHRTLYLIGNSL